MTDSGDAGRDVREYAGFPRTPDEDAMAAFDAFLYWDHEVGRDIARRVLEFDPFHDVACAAYGVAVSYPETDEEPIEGALECARVLEHGPAPATLSAVSHLKHWGDYPESKGGLGRFVETLGEGPRAKLIADFWTVPGLLAETGVRWQPEWPFFWYIALVDRLTGFDVLTDHSTDELRANMHAHAGTTPDGDRAGPWSFGVRISYTAYTSQRLEQMLAGVVKYRLEHPSEWPYA